VGGGRRKHDVRIESSTLNDVCAVGEILVASTSSLKKAMEDWTDNEVEEEWNNMPKPVDEEHNAILASFESLRQIEDVAQVPITARRSTHHPPMHHQHLCRAIGDGGVWMVPHVVQASEAPRDRGLTESRSRRPRSRVEHGSEGLASQGCSGLASNQIEAISWRS
jgi:hypothetical protein